MPTQYPAVAAEQPPLLPILLEDEQFPAPVSDTDFREMARLLHKASCRHCSKGPHQTVASSSHAKTASRAEPVGGGSRGSTCPTCEDCEIERREASETTPEQRKRRIEKQSEIRTARWEMLGVQWDYSALKRVRSCSRVSVRPSGRVDVRQSGDAVGYGGLARCGSIWACPSCSAKIQAERRGELSSMVAQAADMGMTVAFGTVTLRHKRGQSLGFLWDALSSSIRGVSTATKVKRLRKELGQVGYVRATEVTHGDNGWHPHVHTIQLFAGEVTQDQLDVLADAEFSVWESQAKRRGLGVPLRERYELRLVTDPGEAFSQYLAKSVYDPTVTPQAAQSMGFELSGSMTKVGRKKGSRTPWQVLESFVQTGDADDLDIWHEYELASKGKRALVWSPGLKAMFALQERTDEEIAEHEVGSADDVLFTVTDWSPIAAQSWLGGALIGQVQLGGLAAGLAFCDQYGIPYVVP